MLSRGAEADQMGMSKLTVCSVVGSSHAADEVSYAPADGNQQILRYIHAGHHVLEDEGLVLQFSPLARSERSATPTYGAVQRLRPHLVHPLRSPTQ
jgi:hypothetical protein